MTHVMQPFHLLVIAWAGWRNRHQQAVTGCFIQESRFLKDQFEGQWLGFSDKQRQLKKSTFSTQSGLEEWVPTESL